jgi:hypothetical protein
MDINKGGDVFLLFFSFNFLNKKNSFLFKYNIVLKDNLNFPIV